MHGYAFTYSEMNFLYEFFSFFFYKCSVNLEKKLCIYINIYKLNYANFCLEIDDQKYEEIMKVQNGY